MTVFERIMARVQNAFQTGGFEPLNPRRIDALAIPAATGMPGGVSVRDLEKYQVSFGASRFGDNSGGYTSSPIGQSQMTPDIFATITEGENFSHSPGFRKGAFIADPSQADPRSNRGAKEVTDFYRDHVEQV